MRHHLFKFIRHRQRGQRQGEGAGSTLIPIAKSRLAGLFQPLQAATIKGCPLKGGIKQRRAAQRQLCHVVTEFERIIKQQQRALNVVVSQQLSQVPAIARFPQLQAKILRALGQPVGALLQLLSVFELGTISNSNVFCQVQQLAAGERLSKVLAGDVR